MDILHEGNDDTNVNINTLSTNRYSLPIEWNVRNPFHLNEAIVRASSRNALFAHVPAKCTGAACPYVDTCFSWAVKEVRIGDRCVPEIATIINEVEEYKKSLNIADDNYVELTMMRDLIICDITIDRCNKLLAREPMVGMVDKAINKNDTIIQEAAPHVAIDLLEKATNRKYKILDSLNGTRKSKSRVGGGSDNMDISKFMISLKKKSSNTIVKEIG